MLKAFITTAITSICITCNFCFSQIIIDDPSFSYTTALDQNSGISFAIKKDNKSQILLFGSTNGIAKIDSTGKKITSFSQASFQYDLYISTKGLVEVSNSKLLAFGTFTGYQGHTSRNLVRVLPNGMVDQSFVSPFGTNNYVEAVSELPDGKYICSIGYQGTTNGIRRLQSNGSSDPGFSYSGNLQHVAEFIVQADSSILVVFENFIQKLNYNGSINNSFNSAAVGPQGSSGYSDSEILDDGKILFLSNNKVYRLLANGVIDNSFTPIVIPISEFIAQRIVRTNDNKIYISGRRDTPSTTPVVLVKRYHLNGTIDNTFNLGQGFNYEYSGGVNALVPFDDGSLSISGAFSGLNNVCATNIVMLTNSGSPVWMHKLGTGLVDYRAHSMYVDANNHIFVVGDFLSYNGSLRNDITKLDRYGHIDYSFRPGTGFIGTVMDIVGQPDGKVIVCGQFNSYNGTSIQNIVRLNANGTIDNSFNVGTGFSSNPAVLGIQSDGKIIVSGNFGSYNGTSVAGIVRLLPNGSLDPTFTPSAGPNNSILDLIVKPNDEILICGKFTAYAGTSRAKIALLSSNGVLNSSFVPASAHAHNDIRSMAIQSDGKIIVGGDFNSYTDSQSRRVGRLNPNGSVDPTFVSNASMYNFPESIGILQNGRIIIGSGMVSIVESNGSQVAYKNLDLTMSGSSVNDMHVNSSGNPVLVGRFLLDPRKSGISRLKLVPAIQYTQQVLSCGPFTWINGITYTTSTTTPQYTFTNADGVDSIVSLSLIIGSETATDMLTACDSLTWIDGITYTSSTNTPTFTLQNAAGCDSIVTLNLTITHPSSATDLQTACDSFTWPINGQTYTVSGQYTDTIQNTAGCDSIITLDLTITNSNAVTDVQTACDSLTWIDGITYTSSTNTPTVTLENAAGCDSIVTLNLTITHPSSATDLQTACDSFTWPINGQTYTVSGQYTDTIQNTAGCDSIITLDLTITHSNSGTDIQTACDSLVWIDGNTYTSSTNTPTFILQNAAGCDSVITLELTIIPSLPLILENSFSMPSDANSCTGQVAVTVSGNAPFELDFDNGSQVITSSGYALIGGLCAGTHDLRVTDNCGDTLSTTLVIPVDSNYVFNNPFIDSLAQDSLGVTMTNCDIYYNSIDTAYIDSIWATGNTVNVIWNIVDSNGSNFDTTSYVLNNGNGVYWLQLSVFCPFKALGEYFTVTEAIYFTNGSVSTAGLTDHQEVLFAIYPNPTNNQVHISFSGSDAELTVYDVQGKVVLKDRIQNQGTVSLEHFERGVYLFDFNNSNGRSVQRVVKQ